jgi:hypothetical protein
MVDAPLADEAVVAELGILVSDAPEPLKDTAVITPAEKAPDASLETIVDAPFELEAEVLALSRDPEEIFDAFNDVKLEPSPENDVAVIAPAEKAPPASRKTMVDAPLADAAEVLSLVIAEPIQ